MRNAITAVLLSMMWGAAAPTSAQVNGWTNQDIGGPSPAGSFTQSGEVYTISGSGADIWSTADQFHFAHRALVGDGGMVARLTSIDNVHAWAKAGIMIRESLAANSAHSFSLKTPDGGNGFDHQYRPSTGGGMINTGTVNANTPVWLKLERAGNLLTASYAPDSGGAPGAWQAKPAVSIAMIEDVYIGLAVTSHAQGILCQATFDNVSFFGGAMGELAGHWELNGDGTATVGEDGAVSGATAGAGVNGVANAALVFSGGAQAITVPHYDSLAEDDFTVMAWIRPTSLGTGNAILSKQGSNVDGTTDLTWGLDVTATGEVRALLRKGGSTLRTLEAVSATGTVALGNWTHVAATYEAASSSLKIYVNGIEEPAGTSGDPDFGAPDHSRAALDGHLTIGARTTPALAALTGGIDDARVYVVPLTETAIREAMMEADPAAPPNWPPDVELNAPRDAQFYNTDVPMTFAATATDPDGGAIARVEFWVDGVKVGEDTTDDGNGVYSIQWTPGVADSYQVKAVAVDTDTPALSKESETHTIVRSPVVLAGTIVINEIHYNPDLKTDRVEFVELHNPGTSDVDLTGWYFTDGFTYTFPAGAFVPAGGYVVVCEDPDALRSKFSTPASQVFGPYVGRLSNDGELLQICDAGGISKDRVQYGLGFPWPTTGDETILFQPGTGYSIQLVNPYIDNDMSGSWRSGAPSPGEENVTIINNTPPHIRQVDHRPNQPQTGEVATITAKVTDSDGVAAVTLLYQIVDPGAYVMSTDAAYETNWTPLAMNDAGMEGDTTAGDDLYTAQIPATVQRHRRLIRYRIQMADGGGRELTVPYPDDPEPNFAYFVYDGIPSWTGTKVPGAAAVTYTSESLAGPAVYHLISKRSEIEDCTWFDHYAGSEYLYTGTLIYGGEVFDHIQFRARGGVWRYAMRKNMWKIHFNRGHEFQARDNYGRKYPVKWNRLNLGANIQQGDYVHRGEQGLFESVGFRLFELAGVQAPNTHFVHFRIIDEAQENGLLNAAHPPLTSAGTQHDGDFWGLYLGTEQMDGRFLDSHALPDGNLFKMEGGSGELKNTNPLGPSDKSDLNAFIGGYSSAPTEDWWRTNIDEERYYSYRSIVECIHQYDIASGKNYYYFSDPLANEWSQLPWDLDLTWDNAMFGTGEEPFKRNGIFNQTNLNIEYKNRIREIRDLLYNLDQCGQLIDEYASHIYRPGEPSFVDADCAMWDYHWVMTDQAYFEGYSNQRSKAGQGLFYQAAETKDFPGMVQHMKDYIAQRGAWIDSFIANDSNIPAQPIVTAAGPSDFPIDQLTFQVTPFDDPQGPSTFAAMQWRIAEVEPFAAPIIDLTATYFVDSGERWKYFKGTQAPSSPATAWRDRSFDDSAWAEGPAAIGWGDTLPTILDGMAGTYSTFYVRKKFSVANPSLYESLNLEVTYDDGFNAWINGVYVWSENSPGENASWDDFATGQTPNENGWYRFNLPDASMLVAGENVITIQVLNVSLTSSDSRIDARLVGIPADSTGGSEGPQTSGEPGKYEIEPLWESGEITSFANTITIPPPGIREGRTYRVRARMKDDTGRWSHWSAPVQFVAGQAPESPLKAGLRITEVMYHPAPPEATSPYDKDDFEFIEIRNTGSLELDLSNVFISDGVVFAFPAGFKLAAGAYTVLVSNQEAFVSRYGVDIPVAGQYGGNLSNGGENVRLYHDPYGTIVDFEYNDGRGWPLSPDGGGHALVPLDTAQAHAADGSLDYGRNWRAGTLIGGSPGQADPQPTDTIFVNEIMAHTDLDQPPYDSNDWIELVNTGDLAVTLEGCFLSDDIQNLKKWSVPTVTLQPGEFIVFDEVTGFHSPITEGFGLDKAGEQVILSCLPGDGSDRVIDAVRFKGQVSSESVGRYVDGAEWLRAMTPSRGQANQPPSRKLIISELMYHPTTTTVHFDENTAHEFIEIHNPFSVPMPLFNEAGPYRLDGGVSFTFPPDMTIAPNGYLLVLSIDPSDPVAVNDFLSAYGLTPGSVTLVGPYSGVLSNQGERVALEIPEAPDALLDPVVWVIEDEVIYFDQSPWPNQADGLGTALSRKEVERSGNDPNNWLNALPSPGTGDVVISRPRLNGWLVY